MSKKPAPEQLKEAREQRLLIKGRIDALNGKLGTDQWNEETDGADLEREMRALEPLDKLVSRLKDEIDLKIRAMTWGAGEEGDGAPVSVNVITNPTKDADVPKKFRMVRAIRALVLPKEEKFDGIELEMHEEGVKEARLAEINSFDGSGIMIPSMVARRYKMSERERRDLIAGTAASGGYTIATDLGDLIPFLDPMLTIRQLGATFLTDLVGNLDLPRRTARATSGAVAEQGTLSESSPTFDKLSLTPKRQGTYIEASLQMLRQGSVSVENMMRMDLMQAIEELIETYAINGSGSSNQPTGLNTGSIGSVVGGTNGAVPDWADIVDLETALSTAKALRGMTGYLTTPGIAGKLKKTSRDAVAGGFIWEGPNDGRGTLNGYKAMTSTLVPSTLTKGTASGICHAIIFGNWRELIIAMWGGIQIQANPYSLDTTGSVRITANTFADVGVRHAASFAAMVDALVS